MSLEAVLGNIEHSFHSGSERFGKTLENSRIFLDGLAKRLEWVKHIPGRALRTALVLTTLGLIATGSNYVASADYNSAASQVDLKNHPALISSSSLHVDGLSHDVAAAEPNPPDKADFGQAEIAQWDKFVDSMSKSDIIDMGDSHTGEREINITRQAIQDLMKVSDGRPIAFATERFFATPEQQNALDNLRKIQNPTDRQSALDNILNSRPYNSFLGWGKENLFYSRSVGNIDAFENMIRWLVDNGIPIIALDSPPEDYERRLSDKMSIRNQSWATHQADFLKENAGQNFRIVSFGGANHFTQKPSVNDFLQQEMGNNLKILTVDLGNF